jgi:hypothetical protein
MSEETTEKSKTKPPKSPKERYRLALLQKGEPMSEDKAKQWFGKIKSRHAHKLGRDLDARRKFKGRCPKMDGGFYAGPGVCIKQKFVTKTPGCVSCTAEEMIAQTNYIFSRLPNRFPDLELVRVPVKVRRRKRRTQQPS